MLYNYGQSRSRYPISSGSSAGIQYGVSNQASQGPSYALGQGQGGNYGGGAPIDCGSYGGNGGGYGPEVDPLDPCGYGNAPPAIDINGPEVAQLIEEIVAQHTVIREPRITRQVQHVANACGQGKVINVTRRIPEQMPDQIERIVCSTLPQDIVNLYIEKPSTPAAQINTQQICTPGKPPLIQPYIVNLPGEPAPAPAPGPAPGPGPCLEPDVGQSYGGLRTTGRTVFGQNQPIVRPLQTVPSGVINQGFSTGRSQPFMSAQPQVLRTQTVGNQMGQMGSARTGMFQTSSMNPWGTSGQSTGGYGVPYSSYGGLAQSSYGSAPMAYNTQVMPQQSQTRYF